MKITDLPGMKAGSRTRNIVVGLVYAFVILSVIGAIGSPADDGGEAQPVTDGGTDTPTATATQTADQQQQTSVATEEQTTEEQTTTQEQTEQQQQAQDGPTYQVKVDYDGEWSGSFGSAGGQRTVDGSGAETVDIGGDDVSIVSASVQKQDDGSGEMTVQILKDGEVVKESSTSGEYGVVTISYSDF